MTDDDYADDLAFLAPAEYLSHSLVQAAEGIGLYVNANKTELMCFKQEGGISTFSDNPQNFTYLDSNISYTVRDVCVRLTKAWDTIDRYCSYGNLIK